MTTRALATATATLAIALAGCPVDFSGVSIAGVCSPPTPDATTLACEYPATCGTYFAGTPVLDAGTAGQAIDFRLPVEIDNQLPNNADSASGRVNTNDAQITSFEVMYTGVTLPTWNVPATVTVKAAGTAGALLRLIPVQYFASIVPPADTTRQMVVSVRAHGVLTSQDAFTTAWIQVPVEVCNGCLASVTWCPTGKTFAAACPSAPAPSPIQTPTTVLCQ